MMVSFHVRSFSGVFTKSIQLKLFMIVERPKVFGLCFRKFHRRDDDRLSISFDHAFEQVK